MKTIKINPAAIEDLEKGILYSSSYIEEDEVTIRNGADLYIRRIDIASEIDDNKYLYIVTPITN